jgi:immunity protein 52 of polymorphic toxin system
MTEADLPAMVALSDIYHIAARWGRRAEPYDLIASRWLAVIAQLQALDPMFAHWQHWDEEVGLVPFDPTLEGQVARVISRTDRTPAGRLVPEAGSHIWSVTDSRSRSRVIKLNLFAGSDNPYDSNSIILRTDACAVPDPSLVTYRIFRGALLAMAETFEASDASAGSSDARDLDLAWISYVAPRFAYLVTPPASAIVEHRPDGGILMAATDEPFVTANPAHLTVARDIHASLEAFNAVPRTRESGK